MPESEHQLIADLETLNEIAETLNQAVDVRSALHTALERLIGLMELETGWIFIHDEQQQDLWGGRGFRLAAHVNVPPAMVPESEEAWRRGCDCQSLYRKGELCEAYNEVKCSRLASVEGDRRGLEVHASVPLRSGERTLGILNVAGPDWDAFSPRALSLLSNVGSQIGVALERARLFDIVQEKRVHEQATLLAFTNQLLSRLDLDDFMEYLVDEVRELLQVDACALLLLDEADPAHLRFAAASGWRKDPVAAGRRVPADERSGSGRVMRTQQPYVQEDKREDKAEEPSPWRAEWLLPEEFRGAAMVPLVADGHSIGALVVDSREPRRLDDEDVRLLQLMANQAAMALEKARLHREEIRRQRMEEELLVGRQIQLSMLPAGVPQVPGWDFAARYEPARQVGGDFYDFFDLPPAKGDGRRLALVVADVADKGVPAALFMALSRTTIRNTAISDRSPAEALTAANDLILQDSTTDLFLTAFYAALDPGSGRIVYCNAGHNPPLWYQAATGEFQTLGGDGIVLGVLEDIYLEECAVEIAVGDLLIFYTDGVTEAIDADVEEFGVTRLRQAIAARAGGSAEDVVQSILSAVSAHTGDVARHDDFTLLIVKRL